MIAKEEINSCKQIEEKGVRFEPPDDWHGAYHVHHQNKTYPWAEGEDKPYHKPDEFVWLPEISDCLEFLREKRWRNYSFNLTESGGAKLHIIRVPFEFRIEDEIITKGKTILEALLKAVLAVLEEKK